MCKKDIPFRAKYYLCSVSTCRGKRKGLVFCSPVCWDGHLGFARHRESYAEEALAPTREEFLTSQDEEEEDSPMSHDGEKRRIIVSHPPSSGQSVTSPSPSPGAMSSSRTSLPSVETLIVVSKVKKFVRDQSGFNTSQCAIDALTQKVVEECLKGIERANAVGRKTFMGRDVL